MKTRVLTSRAAVVVAEIILDYYDRIGEGPSDRRLEAAEDRWCAVERMRLAASIGDNVDRSLVTINL